MSLFRFVSALGLLACLFGSFSSAYAQTPAIRLNPNLAPLGKVDSVLSAALDGYGTLEVLKIRAEEGESFAQFSLGFLYMIGEGVPQDYTIGLDWLRKAANQGFSGAQNMLAIAYEQGDGVTKDYAMAASWYRRSPEQGDYGAQFSLGGMYLTGKGLPRDRVQAHKWYNLAAAGGDKKAARSRDEVARRMSPAQIAEAQKLAREWRKKEE